MNALDELGKLAGQQEPEVAPVATPEDPKPEVEEPAGDEPEGDEPEGDEPEGDEPEGDEPDGTRRPRAEKRISKLTAKVHEAEERVEAVKAEKTALEAKLAEVQTVAASAVGLHPDYVSADEAALISRATELENQTAELFEHIDGWEEKEMTPAQCRKAYTQAQFELSRIQSRAQALYSERFELQLADMKAGKELRLAKGKAPAVKPGSTPKKPLPVAPVAPAAAGRPLSHGVQRKGMDADRFAKAGGDKDAALRELAELVT
jgi:NADH dehydrogenase/NADH:ubiquinone oxidoreductase subunit G